MDGIKPGGVLCLDLAGVTGWAYGLLTDDKPIFGVWMLPKLGGEGAKYAAFENTLADTMEACQPSWMVIEAALPPQAQTHTSSAHQAYGLRAIALSEAYRASVPWSSVDAMTARLEVLGVARPPDAKAAVIAWCRKRGWAVQHHDSADACVLWEWHRRKMRNGSAGDYREGARR